MAAATLLSLFPKPEDVLAVSREWAVAIPVRAQHFPAYVRKYL
jgi:hypothetical protein